MRIIKPATVKAWASQYPDAAARLDDWMNLVEEADWASLIEMRAVFPSADEVEVDSGRNVVVFNIRGNKYRLIAAVHYDRKRVFVMAFLTHAEYDKDKWKRMF